MEHNRTKVFFGISLLKATHINKSFKVSLFRRYLLIFIILKMKHAIVVKKF